MIRNATEYRITTEQARRFERALANLPAGTPMEMIQRDAVRSQLSDLHAELLEYVQTRHLQAIVPSSQACLCPTLLDACGRRVRSDCPLHGEAALLALPPEQRAEACCHLRMVSFDAVAAQGLDAYEVRRRWPRGTGVCPDCGASGIFYASADHFVAGDW